jgi:hypothetical protein
MFMTESKNSQNLYLFRRAALHPGSAGCLWAGLPRGDFPGIEGQGDAVVWGIPNEEVGVGGVGGMSYF